MEVKKISNIDTEVIVSDEEIFLRDACVNHQKIVDCPSENLCFHDFTNARECVDELFGL